MLPPLTGSESAASAITVEGMTFGWWNTSLSPVGVNRASELQKQVAGKIVKSLIEDFKVDCLALGEVSDSDLIYLKDYCGIGNLIAYNGTLKAGRLQFDTGILYNRSRLSIKNEKSVVSSHGNRNVKIANRVDFVSVKDGSAFYVFVSHWPSRGIHENILTRETIAGRLKEQITAIELSTINPLILVLGDFNDEPFDKSLSWHLLATRDRRLARTGDGYLYNPFWRWLGESEAHSIYNTNDSSPGTYFYKGTTDTYWRTFDQILFSPAFLGNSDWHLNEDKTVVLKTKYLTDLVQNTKVRFDHLPVLSVVEKIHIQK